MARPKRQAQHAAGQSGSDRLGSGVTLLDQDFDPDADAETAFLQAVHERRHIGCGAIGWYTPSKPDLRAQQHPSPSPDVRTPVHVRFYAPFQDADRRRQYAETKRASIKALRREIEHRRASARDEIKRRYCEQRARDEFHERLLQEQWRQRRQRRYDDDERQRQHEARQRNAEWLAEHRRAEAERWRVYEARATIRQEAEVVIDRIALTKITKIKVLALMRANPGHVFTIEEFMRLTKIEDHALIRAACEELVAADIITHRVA